MVKCSPLTRASNHTDTLSKSLSALSLPQCTILVVEPSDESLLDVIGTINESDMLTEHSMYIKIKSRRCNLFIHLDHNFWCSYVFQMMACHQSCLKPLGGLTFDTNSHTSRSRQASSSNGFLMIDRPSEQYRLR